MMEENQWDTLSPNKSETYFDPNDQLYGNLDLKNYQHDDPFILSQLEGDIYQEHNQGPNQGRNGHVTRSNHRGYNGQVEQGGHSQGNGQGNGNGNGHSQGDGKIPNETHTSNGSHIPSNVPNPLDKLNDFSLDNYDFVLDESNINIDEMSYNQGTGSNHQPSPNKQQYKEDYEEKPYNERYETYNSSSAFPPTSSVQNTPNMLPNGKRIMTESQVISSPILPSQNDKSFNKQHYYHKLSRRKSKDGIEHLPHSQHVRPDVVFTPLVSPHGTPLDKKNHSKPIQASFEPLTSPALNAQGQSQNQNQNQGGHPGQIIGDGMSKRRSSSSVFSTVDENKPNAFKRRTPHGTPIIQTLDNNGHSTKSPAGFEKLPEASITRSHTNSSSNSTPMLPPQSFKKIDPESTNTSPQMMGFTMGKLAKQQTRVQESPVLKSRKSSFGSAKSSDASPNLMPTEGKYEKTSTKKASHKLAEQGRRNRMNTAVQALGTLIPQNYHDRVSIPSKATTVELASSYIKDLVRELESLKR